MAQNSEINAPKAKKIQKNTKDIYNGLNNLVKKDVETSLDFPLDVFPEVLQEVIYNLFNVANFPKDFTACSILYAVSVATGATYRAQHPTIKSWKEYCNLWVVLTARAGSTKSHPLNWALAPLSNIDKQNYKIYKESCKEVDNWNRLPKAQQKEKEQPKEPIYEHFLSTGTTIEAVSKTLSENPRGFNFHADEVFTWLGNFNKYNKGDEVGNWLSFFNGGNQTIKRAHQRAVYIANPFVSVGATTQTSRLKKLANQDFIDLGFIDRILFCIIEVAPKEWQNNEIDLELQEKYSLILDKIASIKQNFDVYGDAISNIVNFNPESKELLFNWQKDNTALKNKERKNEYLQNLYSKLENYIMRFSLILEVIEWSLGKSQLKYISVKSVEGAIKITEYFRLNAHKLHDIITGDTPLDQIKKAGQRDFLESLPEIVKTGEAYIEGKKFNISQSAVKTLLNNEKLFKHLKQGEFERKY